MGDVVDSTALSGGMSTTKENILETGASIAQDFSPVNRICAHLNAFHVYASEPDVCVESNHYCSHVNEDVRQCLIYDSPERNARLIGVEYMVTPRIYETFDEDERKLWHSHVFEVKSGMLVMPKSSGAKGALVPEAAWEKAETAEMETVVGLYGKTYHFWRVERGDAVPLGPPQLMMSFVQSGQVDVPKLEERDKNFGVDHRHKADIRKSIPEPKLHPDADSMWKGSSDKAKSAR